jgi:hypothetical protein
MAREYFHCYHSMLRGTRNLSEAECGRLFRALLAYSAGDELINLQGREAAVFDVYAEQIDREKAAYEEKCNKLRQNGRANATNCHQLPANASNCYQMLPNASNCQQGEDEDEDEGEEKYTPPVSPSRGRRKPVFEHTSEAYRVAKYLSERIIERIGIAPHTESTLQTWADDIDKLHRVDKRPWDEISRVMEWSQYNDFWQVNILSGGNFRKKYHSLLSKAKQEGYVDG